MEADALAERILLDLKNIFKKDPLIDEFDILPVGESYRNTSPVIHIDHKVALEDWCIKHVYVYAYSKFFSWRKKPYKVDSDSILMWSSAILLINPEPETVWNTRKELVCQNVALPENELKFSELVLSRKPKSSPVYSHRKWVLLEIMKRDPSPCTIRQVVDHEIQLCIRCANLYPNNYYAWCQRSWVITQIDGLEYKTVSDELERTEKWASTHVSDHCGFHYRQFLLSCLRKNPTSINNQISFTSSNNVQNNPCHNNEDSSVLNNCPLQLSFSEAIVKELDFLGSLQTAYPGHEALWYHRRYLLQEVGKLGAPYCKSNGTEHRVKPGCYVGVSGSSTGLGLNIQNVACGQSHIEEIHSAEDEDSMEVSGLCMRDKLGCANVEQGLSSDEKGILSSLGDIHSLVLEDTETAEGFAQCKRCKMEGDTLGQEQNKKTIHSNNLKLQSDCSNDSETGEIVFKIPSECKRCKLDCVISEQGTKPGQKQTAFSGDIHSLKSVHNKIPLMEESALHKSHQAAFCNTGQEQKSKQNGNSSQEDLVCDNKMEESASSKNHTFSGASTSNTLKFDYSSQHPKLNLEIWSKLEEENFLTKQFGNSCEDEWERTLIQRHVVWLSRTLKWSITLS